MREFQGNLAGIGLVWTLGFLVGSAPLAAEVIPPGDAAEGHWAFQPLATQQVPSVKAQERVRTPIDAFVLAKLEENGLTFSPDADPFTLIRRLHLDLIGLPPSLEWVDSARAADLEASFESAVDALLASPHFGERWGRHWLDWAGYVDVLGGDNDAGNAKVGDGKWRYRDYVVRALNADKPFDRFLLEQLAGDELVDWRNAPIYTEEIRELLIATGFLRTASDDTDEKELNTPNVHHDILQRTGELVANNLLALTLQCAKCHDHKYEPISQRDYYRYISLFSGAFNPDRWLQPKERAIPDVSPAEKQEIERHNAPFDQQIDALKQRQAQVRKPYEQQLFETKLGKLPEAIRADTKLAIETLPEKRTEIQKYLAEKFSGELKVKPDEIEAALSAADRTAIANPEEEITRIAAKRRTWGTIQAVYQTGPPPVLQILHRGEFHSPGEQVEPGFFSALGNGQFSWLAAASTNSSGRRLTLARWLTAPDTPAAALVARVFVNRVWQQLLGQGLVETSDNFGLSGARPSHPELLDWLATEFIRNDWRIKPLIRLIVSSTVYRQSAEVHSAGVEPEGSRDARSHPRPTAGLHSGHALRTPGDMVDPANRLLWRQRLRRLESEIIRDSILAVSDHLDPALGGPPLLLENRPGGLVIIKEKSLPTPARKYRRSIYVLARRNYHLTMLNTFDQPAVSMQCIRRISSSVVSQPLIMLNDSFVLEHAALFAARVARTVPDASALEERVAVAFQFALGRPPSPDETDWSVGFLREQRGRLGDRGDSASAQSALTQLCHVLLNTSEFLYVP